MTGDNDAITLADAAQHFGFTVLTLKAEADRGRLALYKIGGRYYTTRKAVENLDRCWYAKRNPAPQGRGIYVVGFDRYIKIGWSADLPARLRALQIAAPVELTVHATFACQKVNEGILLRRFRKQQTRGEWFRHEGELAEWIKNGCHL